MCNHIYITMSGSTEIFTNDYVTVINPLTPKYIYVHFNIKRNRTKPYMAAVVIQERWNDALGYRDARSLDSSSWARCTPAYHMTLFCRVLFCRHSSGPVSVIAGVNVVPVIAPDTAAAPRAHDTSVGTGGEAISFQWRRDNRRCEPTLYVLPPVTP